MERLDIESGAGGQREEGAEVTYLGKALWAKLLDSNSPTELAPAWLALQCGMIEGAVQGMVALADIDANGPSPAAWWPEGRAPSQELVDSAEMAVKQGRGIVRTAAGPGRQHQVAFPFMLDGRLRGVVSVAVKGRERDELEGIIRQIQWGSAWIESGARKQDHRISGVLSTRITITLDLVVTALAAADFAGACTAVATMLSARIPCDRAAIGARRGGSVRIVALSGKAEIDARTQLSLALGEAMDEAIDQDDWIVLPPHARDDAPSSVRAHEALARRTSHPHLLTLPLPGGNGPLGAVLLERSNEPFGADDVALVRTAASVLGPILEAKRREDRAWYERAMETVVSLAEPVVGSESVGPKLLAAAIALGAVFLLFAKGEYRIDAEAVLEAQEQRVVAVPYDGYIREAPVRAGDRVVAGALLASLDDREMSLEYLRHVREHAQYEQEFRKARAENDRLAGELARSKMAQAQAQVDLLKTRLDRAQLVAPFDALVLEGDLSQSLGAPVRRGEVLFDLAPLEGYRLILEVDERDIADVDIDQSGIVRLNSLPGEDLAFRVTKTTSVSAADEGRNYYRVEAELDASSPRLRPGMEGVAKIGVDRRRLIWIWTHAGIDWLRLRLWAWMP